MQEGRFEKRLCVEPNLHDELGAFSLAALNAAEYGIENHLVLQSLVTRDFKWSPFFDCSGRMT